MSPRNFRYAITQAKAAFLVAVSGERIAGYGLVALHAGTRIGRLSSFAVDPQFRRFGIARRLLAELERAAAVGGCRSIRLEVRRDNSAAIALYTHAGFSMFGVYPNYYEDNMAALRLEKPLTAAPDDKVADRSPTGRDADR